MNLTDKIKDNWKNLYVIIFLIIFVFLIAGGISPNFSSKNTLDIISLLVQSEAAVIAIVITLSLVAVQIVASAYSTRVTEIFKHSRSFWCIVGLYISSITIGIITLILADNSISIYIQKWVLIDYYLGIVSFVSLIAYIWITFDLLNISTVIHKWALRIKKNELLEGVDNLLNDSDKTESGKKLLKDIDATENIEYNDVIQPIIDIIRESLNKYDYETVRDGLKKIDYQINIFKTDLKAEEVNRITRYLLKKFKRVLYLAISKKDEDSTIEILIMLLKNGIFDPNWKYDKEILALTTNFIKDINNLAMDQRMNIVVRDLTLSFGAISEIAAKNKDDTIVTDVLFLLENIFNDSMNRNMDVAAKEAANSVVTLEKAVITNELESFKQPFKLLHILDMGFNFVERAIEEENDGLALSLFKKFFNAGSIVVEHKLDSETKYVIIFMEELRKKAIEKKLNVIEGLITVYFGEIFKLGIKYDNDVAINGSTDAIMDIARTAEKESVITKISLIPSLKNLVKTINFLKPKYKDKYVIESTIKEINEVIDKLEKDILTL